MAEEGGNQVSRQLNSDISKLCGGSSLALWKLFDVIIECSSVRPEV